ncbi:MAG: hypothetical protein AAB966_00955, partial [Patescibacteria group bacterium]
ISKLILSGRDSEIVGLKEYLSQSLKIDVQTAEVWGNIFSLNNSVPEINFLDSLNYAVAIGLAAPEDEN